MTADPYFDHAESVAIRAFGEGPSTTAVCERCGSNRRADSLVVVQLRAPVCCGRPMLVGGAR